MRKTVAKTTALGLVACAMALTWTQSGWAQADCIVQRGQDPLDVLTVSAVKHNVWIALDSSGSMNGGFPGAATKIDAARNTIIQVLDALEDGSGRPLVNWGLTYYDLAFRRSLDAKCATLDDDGDGFPERPSNCEGMDQQFLNPPPCEGDDPRQEIKDIVNGLIGSDGRLIDNAGGTPNGIMLDELSTHIQTFTQSQPLLFNQKNFIILLTDGVDTCECYNYMYDLPDVDTRADSHVGTPRLRGSSAVSDPSEPFTFARPDCSDPGAPDPPDCWDYGATNDGNQHEIDVAAYNAGLKGQVAFRRISDSNQDGIMGDGNTFIIGLGLGNGKPRINHLAWQSSGVVDGEPGHPALFADNVPELVQALEDVFNRIGVPESTVSLGASVVGSVKEVVPTHTDPTLSPDELIASSAGDITVRNLRTSLRNNVLFTTSVETPGFRGHLRAFNIFQVQSDGTRTADFTEELWDAGEELQNRDASSRQIFFNRAVLPGTPPPAPLQFAAAADGGDLTDADLGVGVGFLSGVDPTGQGAQTAEDAVRIVENVIRGRRLVIDPVNGFYDGSGSLNFSDVQEDGTTPTWKLLEAANAAPAVVLNPPRSPDIDPVDPATEYTTFYGAHVNRVTTVYLGTSGGMMHAFRADNGFEIYAYIPHDLLRKLPNLVRNLVSGSNGLANHEYFVASSATVQDVHLREAPSGNPEWRTVLSFARGPGGKFLTALDITDVGEWDGTSSASPPTGFQPPQLLFTVGNNDGVVDLDGTGENYDGLGETWSVPVMGRVQDGTPEGQWVLFAGSGYGCEGTEEGRFLYVLALEDGTVYRKLGPIPDAVDGAAGDVGVDQNALVAPPALFNPHEPGMNDGRNFVTRVYIGDLQGLVHKLDCTDPDPANWEFGVFFEVTSEADAPPGEGFHDQPISVQATILKLSTTNRILIFLGTGGDSRVEQVGEGRFKIVGLEDTDSPSTIAVSDPAFAGNLILTDTGDPFFFDLEEEHRVLTAPVAARNTSTNGAVFFASTASEFDITVCAEQFFSVLTATSVNGGLGSFDLDPTVGGVQGTVDLGEGKVTGLFHRDEHLYVSKSGGLGFGSGTMVLGSDTFPTPPLTSPNLQLLVETFRLSPF